MQITKEEKSNQVNIRLNRKFNPSSLEDIESVSIHDDGGSFNSNKSSERSLVDALTDVPSKSISHLHASEIYNVDGYLNEYVIRKSSPILHSVQVLEEETSEEKSVCTTPEPDYATPSNPNTLDRNDSLDMDMSSNEVETSDGFNCSDSEINVENRYNHRQSDCISEATNNYVGSHLQNYSNDEYSRRIPDFDRRDRISEAPINIAPTYSRLYTLSKNRNLENRISTLDCRIHPIEEENEKVPNDDYAIIRKAKNIHAPECQNSNSQKFQKYGTPNGIKKPPRYSCLLKQNKTLADKSEYYRSSPDFFASNHHDTIQLERIPSGEIKRNKIVLRVPSFRTAECQTETFRTVRRRASCAQTNLSVAPKSRKLTSSNSYRSCLSQPLKNVVINSATSTPRRETSSSSGYSSPEINSKLHLSDSSSPPSPGSVFFAKTQTNNNKPNITIIEVNKSGNTTLISTLEPPPRPPKSIKFRHSSASEVSKVRGILKRPHSEIYSNEKYIKSENRSKSFRYPHSSFRIRNYSESDEIDSITVPRIVDLQPKIIKSNKDRKTKENSSDEQHTPRLPWLSLPNNLIEQDVNKMPESVINDKELKLFSQSFNDLDLNIGHKWREERENELAECLQSEAGGRATAAYLASLELLASHYRHQAIVNAKVSLFK